MHLETRINSSNVEVLVCMGDGCSNVLKPKLLRSILDKEQYERLAWFRKRAKLSRDPRVRWCPTPDCPGYMRGSTWRSRLRCPHCKLLLCYRCNRAWHPGSPCMGSLEDQFHRWAMGQGVQPCPKCGVPIMKSEGCNHITCVSCSHEWCWLCRETYTPDHYASWNINGCAGRQFRDMSPGQMEKRMSELHGESMHLIAARTVRSWSLELLCGACWPCGLVAVAVRALLGPGLGLPGDVQLQMPQRRIRESARRHLLSFMAFLVSFCVQVPVFLIGLVSAALLTPGLVLSKRCWEPRAKHPVKVTITLFVTALGALVGYPLLACGLLLMGPAVRLVQHAQPKGCRARCGLFAAAVVATPPSYALGAAGLAGAAALALLLGPGTLAVKWGEDTEHFKALVARGSRGRVLATRCLLFAGGTLGLPLAHALAALAGVIILWVTLHFVFLFVPLVLAYHFALKDEWFIGSGSFRGDFNGFVPDPLVCLVLLVALAVPSLPLVPMRALLLATHGLRSLTRQERAAAGGFLLLAALVAWQLPARWHLSGWGELLAAFAVASILAGGILARRLTSSYLSALESDGTGARAGVKPPSLVIWLCLLPPCLLFVPLACLCAPMWMMTTNSMANDTCAARCWLAHWAAFFLLPSELALNVLVGPSCALSGRLKEAGLHQQAVAAVQWVTLPLSPPLWVLALLAWAPLALLSGAVTVARRTSRVLARVP